MRLKGDQATTRALNRRMILDLLRRQGPMSRRDLSRSTGLSGGAVSALIQEFMDEDLVKEGKAGQSSGGRKPIPVSINYGGRLSIGVKLMEQQLEAVLTDLSSRPLKNASLRLTEMTPTGVADHVADLVQELVPNAPDRKNRLIGVGLAMPGFVDIERGVILDSHRFGWADVPIASLISSRIETPVWVDNDVNAYAIAQRLFGLARTARSAVVIILGTGIGAALIIDGKIHRGAAYRGGEIGFFPPPDGTEQSLSGQYSVQGLRDEWYAVDKNIALETALYASDARALAFMEKKGRSIGQLIALFVQLVDPEVVVIGGETLQYGRIYADAMAGAVESRILQPHVVIAFDTENDLWTRGAAVLAIDHFFDFENVGGHLSTTDIRSSDGRTDAGLFPRSDRAQ